MSNTAMVGSCARTGSTVGLALSNTRAFLCRSSFYISLLGLKIPLALLVRASRARRVFNLLLLAWVPSLIYCHVAVLPLVREADCGVWVWHILTAMWVTLPLLVVGSVIVSHMPDPSLVAAFLCTIAGVACFHWLAIPALKPTWLGTALLQLLFAFFEDGSTAGWIWCLYHVLRLQDAVSQRRALRECPIEASAGPEDRVLIVGNAPTVTGGEPLGAVIDGFSNVVRFNSYSVDQPDFTGSKVSYHFSNGRKLPSAKTVRAVLPIFNASLTHAVYLFMPHMEDAREICDNLLSCKANAWFVDEERLLALRRKIGMNIWQIPSSGMVAIDVFLSRHKEVSLHGFNFFAGKQIHYFEESPLQLLTSWLERFVTHNPPQEKKWVESLMEEERASFLAKTVAAAQEIVHEADPEESEEVMEGKLLEKEKLAEDGEARKRYPGLVRTLLKDGIPSQFSI